MNLSEEQQAAFDRIVTWYREQPRKQCLTLGGFAGTGKTTLVSALLEAKVAHIGVVAPTGKAAEVLRRKGVACAETIHSFLYNFQGEDLETGELQFLRKEETARPQLLICDESSMVPLPIYQDLLATGLRILWVGDHGQLEPVGEDAGLMRNPEIRLETIHRQAANSPILAYAHHVRMGGEPYAAAGDALNIAAIEGIDRGYADPLWLCAFDQILTAFNRTRVFLNMQIRAAAGYGAQRLVEGEKVIVLQNKRDKGLFNGSIVTVERIHRDRPDAWEVTLRTDDGRTPHVELWKGHFHKEKRVVGTPKNVVIADYGYAITCHKSQGSEWDRILVIEEPSDHWSMARWRYTAATRAAQVLEYRTNALMGVQAAA